MYVDAKALLTGYQLYIVLSIFTVFLSFYLNFCTANFGSNQGQIVKVKSDTCHLEFYVSG